MCERIICTLDPKDGGYFRASLRDLLAGRCLARTTCSWPKRRSTLVQSLDPPGIAARDLRECLLVQLTPDMHFYEELRTLITNHLEDLRDNRLPQIQKVDRLFRSTRFSEAWDELRKLNPKPGAEFGESIRADGHARRVRRARRRRHTTKSSSKTAARRTLHISEYYRERLASGAATPEEREFIKRKINAAQWLIESIEQRRSTLTKVSQAIVDHQTQFLDEGPGVHRAAEDAADRRQGRRARHDRQPRRRRQVDSNAARHFPAQAVLRRRHQERRRRRRRLGHHPHQAARDRRQGRQDKPPLRRRTGRRAEEARPQRRPPHGHQVPAKDGHPQLAPTPRLVQNRPPQLQRRLIGRTLRLVAITLRVMSPSPASTRLLLRLGLELRHLPVECSRLPMPSAIMTAPAPPQRTIPMLHRRHFLQGTSALSCWNRYSRSRRAGQRHSADPAERRGQIQIQPGRL